MTENSCINFLRISPHFMSEFFCGCMRAVNPCIFCAYVSQQAERALIYEDELVVAFQSKAPAASKHLLVVPREHLPTVRELGFKHIPLLKHMQLIGKKVLDDIDVPGREEKKCIYGFHVPPFNSVDHLHLHCFLLPFFSEFKRFKYLPGSPWFITVPSLLRKLDPELHV